MKKAYQAPDCEKCENMPKDKAKKYCKKGRLMQVTYHCRFYKAKH